MRISVKHRNGDFVTMTSSKANARISHPAAALRRGLAALDETPDIVCELSQWFDKKITDEHHFQNPMPQHDHDYAGVQLIDVPGSSDIDSEDSSSEVASDPAEKGEPQEGREMNVVVSAAMRKAPTKVLVNISGIAVTRADLETLDGLNWLNDKIMDVYLNLVAKRSQEDSSLPRVYAFSVFLMQVYAEHGYGNVRLWTQQVDLFSHDMLLVPVHMKDHWCMTIVDLRLKQITYFDSMFDRNDGFLRKVLHYLRDEMMDKKNSQLVQEDWLLTHSEDHPKQLNSSDCGVFALKFADYASRDLKLNFTQADIPYFRQRMIFEILRSSMLPTA